MVTAFLEWGGEAIEELPMALAMFDAAVENERKTDPMMPTISYGYATWKPAEKTVLETIEEADSNMYRTKHRYYLEHDIPENRWNKLIFAFIVKFVVFFIGSSA